MWVWRTPLERTQPFWEGWYKGLSEAFLNVSAPKVLMLAGTDRLDKPLMVGQMQGRFQLSLLPQVAHASLGRQLTVFSSNPLPSVAAAFINLRKGTNHLDKPLMVGQMQGRFSCPSCPR